MLMEQSIKINGIDFSEYLIDYLSLPFKFSDTPGNVTFSPIENIRLSNHFRQYSKYDPSSPFIGINNSGEIPLELNLGGVKKKGTIQDITDTGTVIELTIKDSVSDRINAQQVLALYENKTPVELLSLLCEAYGISINGNYLGLIKNTQLQAGLQYDLKVGLDDDISLINVFNSLSKAGYFRICIWNNTVYCIPSGEPTSAGVKIMDTDILSIPTQAKTSTQKYNGGAIQYSETPELFVRVPKDLSLDFPSFEENYSGSGILKLRNPSGGLSLIKLYSDSLIQDYWSFDVKKDYASVLNPGVSVLFDCNIFNEDIYGRIVGKRLKSSDSQLIYTIDAEIFFKRDNSNV